MLLRKGSEKMVSVEKILEMLTCSIDELTMALKPIAQNMVIANDVREHRKAISRYCRKHPQCKECPFYDEDGDPYDCNLRNDFPEGWRGEE